MPNFNPNSKPLQKVQKEQENLGVFINLRLPARAIATGLSIVVAFAGGVCIGGIQNQNLSQNNVDCSVSNKNTEQPTK